MSQLTELTDFLIANMPRRAMQGFDSQMDEIAFIPAQRDTGLGQYKEIQEKMTARQAGLLIRILEDKPVKTSWQIDLPARAFLGIGQDDFNRALARQLQAIGFGWDVNAQDIRGRA